MACLFVLKQGRPFLRFRLDKDEVSIGRGDKEDLHIPDARISREHLVVKREKEGFRLIDRSTNGTFVNGVRTQEVLLQDQDIITLGACQIRFEQGGYAEQVATMLATSEGGALSYDASNERILYAKPVLKGVSPQGSAFQFPIRSEVISIGSGRTNDLVLPDLGGRDCQLLGTADGFAIRRLNPDASISVNGSNLVQDMPIPYGSILRLGGTTLQLELEQGSDPVVPLKVTRFEGMVGATPRMRKLFSLIDRFSRHNAPVMILGETGTGKELVARALHVRGHRARGPFVAVNCSAISAQLFESELFGHVKGAFTGAIRDQIGAIESAHKGTMFLDELGDMPRELQAKLLRVLETSTMTPVGSHVPRTIDVRFIAATHKDLEKEVEAGRFRTDLFYRLFVLTLELAPLRDRIADIPALVDHFLREATVEGPPPRLDASALRKLVHYNWPGNVRELRHVLTRAIAASGRDVIDADLITFMGPRISSPVSRKLHDDHGIMKLEEMEKQAIQRALALCGDNRKEAARALGIARSTLHLRMQKHGLADDSP